MPLSNGVPIVPTRNPAQFAKLAPAPFSPFSSQPENIANSIFSQSQVRYAPQTFGSFGQISPQAPNYGGDLLGGQPAGNAVTENALGGFNPLQLLSGARDSPVEQFAKIARNLLSHENQELFGNLLGAAKASTQSLTSHGFGKGAALSSSSSTAVEPATLIASSASKDNKEKVEEEKKSLSESQLEKLKEHAKTEDELRLLKAAINNGELDPESLR